MNPVYENYNDLEESATKQGYIIKKADENRAVVIGGLAFGYKMFVYARPVDENGWYRYEINLEAH